ncbi:MAG: hypothetical protein ACM3NQ_22300 [Bacteroidales bacterium]
MRRGARKSPDEVLATPQQYGWCRLTWTRELLTRELATQNGRSGRHSHDPAAVEAFLRAMGRAGDLQLMRAA